MTQAHERDDDRFAEQLVQVDEALAAGQRPSHDDLASSTPESQRLAKNIRCLQLLRNVSQARRSGSGTLHSRSSSSTPMLDADLEESARRFPRPLGHFELKYELGRGGYGVVYLALDQRMKRLVAIKIPHTNVLMRDDLQARFKHEAQAAGSLDHPHIVQVYESGSFGPICYIASAFCPGINLQDWLDLQTEPVPCAEAVQLIQKIADAVFHANQRGVFHRDLKPANVILQIGEGLNPPPLDAGSLEDHRAQRLAKLAAQPLHAFIPRITDFGLAKTLDNGSFATLSGAILGTPSYMAPEQAMGKVGQPLAQADVYSLGAILYQLLVSRVPFHSDSPVETLRQVIHNEPLRPSRTRRDIPRDLETICLKCLEKTPERRYGSAGELADDLDRYSRHEPIRARSITSFEYLWKICRRKPLVASLVMALLMSVVCGFVATSILWYQAENRREQAEIALDSSIKSTQEANEQRNRSERMLYFHSIALADRGYMQDIAGAREILHGCQDNLRGWEWRYLNQVLNYELVELNGHTRASTCCEFSPNGQILATCSGSWGKHFPGEIVLWDVRSGKKLQELQGYESHITSVSFHPSGKWLASSEMSWQEKKKGVVLVWDLESGRPIAKLDDASGVFCVKFSNDGSIVATAGADRVVRVYETSTWRLIHQLRGHTDNVFSIAITPDGKSIFSGGRDGLVRLCDIETGRVRFERDDLGDVRDVAISPNGRRLACSTFSGRIEVWEVETWKRLLGHDAHSTKVNCVNFSPDSGCLVKTTHDKVEIWNVANKELLRSFPSHRIGTTSVAYSPDGTLLASVGNDRKVRIWSLFDDPAPKHRVMQQPFIKQVRSIPQSNLVVFGSRKNESHFGLGDGDFAVRIASLNSAQPPKLLTGHKGWLTQLDCSLDGKFVATASEDGTACVWEVATASLVRKLTGHDGPVYDVAFLNDDVHLVTSGADGTVRIWNMHADEPPAQIAVETEAVKAIACSPSGRWLAWTGAGGAIRVWDVQHREEASVLNGHSAPVQLLTFSPDGCWLASSSKDSNIHLWHAEDFGRKQTTARPIVPLRTIAAPEREINDIEFTSDGTRIVCASVDFGSSVLRLFDATTGHEAIHLAHVPQAYPTATYSPLSDTIIMACGFGWFEFKATQTLATAEQRFTAIDKQRDAWHERSASAAELNDPSTSLYHLNKLLESRPQNTSLLYRRANVLARLQEWEAALDDFKRWSDLTGVPHWYHDYAACVALASNNPAEYYSACDHLIELLGHSSNHSEANLVAWMLALRAPRPADRSLMLERAESAVRLSPTATRRQMALNTLALVQYRLGQYPSALESLRTAIRSRGNRLTEDDWVVLSLVHFALGNHAIADQSLDRVTPIVASEADVGSRRKPRSSSWGSSTATRVLYEEAVRIIRNGDKSNDL